MDTGPMPTWCPQCGPHVRVDSDGTCITCGSDAMGSGADAALQLRADVERLTRELREARAAIRGTAPPCEFGFCRRLGTHYNTNGDPRCDEHAALLHDRPPYESSYAPAIRAAEGDE